MLHQKPTLAAFLLDAVFLSRPVVLIPVWGFAVFGYWCGLRQDVQFSLNCAWGMDHGPALGWILLFSLSVGAVYIINQVADYTVDQVNAGFPLLPNCGISQRQALLVAAVYAVVAICGCLVHSLWLCLCAVSAIVLGVVYSCKPTLWSGRPVFDFLSNAFGYGVIAFGAGWILSGHQPWSLAFVKAATPYALLMCAGSISSTIPDIPGDRACGKRTTAVALGSMPAHLLATSLLMLAALVAWQAGDWIALAASVLCLPFYLAYIRWPRPLLQEATYKAGGVVIMVLACIVFPLLVLPGIVAGGATWIYFRLRHGISYPSLAPAQTIAARH